MDTCADKRAENIEKANGSGVAVEEEPPVIQVSRVFGRGDRARPFEVDENRLSAILDTGEHIQAAEIAVYQLLNRASNEFPRYAPKFSDNRHLLREGMPLSIGLINAMGAAAALSRTWPSNLSSCTASALQHNYFLSFSHISGHGARPQDTGENDKNLTLLVLRDSCYHVVDINRPSPPQFPTTLLLLGAVCLTLRSQ
eukprot:IDg23437t1